MVALDFEFFVGITSALDERPLPVQAICFNRAVVLALGHAKGNRKVC